MALTPLIDVVFLLLMFFMLTTSFDKFTTIDLNIGGTGPSVPTTKITNILVRVHSESQLDVNGEPVDGKNLAQVMQAIIAGQELDPGNIRILLQPRAKSNSQAIVDTVFTLKKMKISNIVIVR